MRQNGPYGNHVRAIVMLDAVDYPTSDEPDAASTGQRVAIATVGRAWLVTLQRASASRRTSTSRYCVGFRVGEVGDLMGLVQA